MNPELRELLEGPNLGHLATLMADGAPHSVALWVTVVEGDRLAFVVLPDSVKGRNIARDPRVALSMVDHADPYRTAQLRGRVVATRTGDDAMDVLDVMARVHTGAAYPERSDALVAYEVEIDRATVAHIEI